MLIVETIEHRQLLLSMSRIGSGITASGKYSPKAWGKWRSVKGSAEHIAAQGVARRCQEFGVLAAFEFRTNWRPC